MTQDSENALSMPEAARLNRRRREFLAFLVLAFGIWPIVAVAIVGSYGFLIWMYQIFAGPPGPLGH